MYRPTHFDVTSRAAQLDLIRACPLGVLISSGTGGLSANAVPFLVEEDGDHGILRAHLARANPQWRELAAGGECLVVFQGADGYVTPGWYETKREHGRVVPTWNYATVHAWGIPRVIDDAEWLREQVEDLTTAHEAGRQEPWAVADAPEAFVAAQIRAIVGIEIPISRIEGKWKMSQNRPECDRRRVAAGFRAEGRDDLAVLVGGVCPV